MAHAFLIVAALAAPLAITLDRAGAGAPACSTPTQHRLLSSGVAPTIVEGNVRFTLVGDSLSASMASPRMPGGIRRTWPVTWTGDSSPAFGSHDGAAVDTATGPGILRGHRYSFSHVYSGGQSGIFPGPGLDMWFTADISSGIQLMRSRLSYSTEYLSGPWHADAPLRSRIVYWQDAGMASTVRIRGARGVALGPWIEPLDMTGPARIASLDFAMPVGAGLPATELRFQDSDGSEAGSRIYHATTHFYEPGAHGFSLDTIATGGATAANYLDTALISDDGLAQYLDATRHGEDGATSAFMIMLGTNMTAAEANGVLTVWKANIDAIIDRFESACATIGAGQPKFLLVVPWGTHGGPDPRRVQINTALRAIADERPNCGVVDLYAYFPVSPTVGGADNAHQESEEEADILALAIWNELLLAVSDCNGNGVKDACEIAAGDGADLNRTGVLDECELSCAADFDGDGAVGASDLALVLGGWGMAGVADLDDDGVVDAADLALLLGAWGPCGEGPE